jgi:hypothetical protein
LDANLDSHNHARLLPRLAFQRAIRISFALSNKKFISNLRDKTFLYIKKIKKKIYSAMVWKWARECANIMRIPTKKRSLETLILLVALRSCQQSAEMRKIGLDLHIN